MVEESEGSKALKRYTHKDVPLAYRLGQFCATLKAYGITQDRAEDMTGQLMLWVLQSEAPFEETPDER